VASPEDPAMSRDLLRPQRNNPEPNSERKSRSPRVVIENS
jgi:hypothetical protein